jgi:hypothetical protein
MPTHDDKLSGIGKFFFTDSWSQCALFQSNGQKKAQVFAEKHTFSP